MPSEIASEQTWFKRGSWVQSSNLFCPLKVGAVGSVSLGTQCRGVGSSQHVGGSRASTRKGVKIGAEEWVSQCSPGTILTVVPGSALQKALKEMFPIESGDINTENRIIPHLPGEGQAPWPGGGNRNCSWEIPWWVELCWLPPRQVCGAVFAVHRLEIKTPERSEQWQQFSQHSAALQTPFPPL